MSAMLIPGDLLRRPEHIVLGRLLADNRGWAPNEAQDGSNAVLPRGLLFHLQQVDDFALQHADLLSQLDRYALGQGGPLQVFDHAA
jgi:hypothetical protein